MANAFLLSYAEEKLSKKLGIGDFTEDMNRSGLLKDLAPQTLLRNQSVFPEFFDIFANARIRGTKNFASESLISNLEYQRYKQMCDETEDKFQTVLIKSVVLEKTLSKLTFLKCFTLMKGEGEGDYRSRASFDILMVENFQ